ncbi:alpha/beta hydrolase [Jatrophihabitans telluris]|uniref:Alpha/beta hydrolase n=1 Tax=Jatrophihabitans telluris TaxID=2038343 RepID=A0ABY4QUC4_9ACTN|nr:alpha/beta hydrolase [Jatrophihabitans telluris]UQX86682.1 alpha/beta hydrolase [Jatrophihabitans telluris]
MLTRRPHRRRVAPSLAVVVVALSLVTACTKSGKNTTPSSSVTSSAMGSGAGSSSPSQSPSPTSSQVAALKFSDCTGQFQTAIASDRALAMSFFCGKLPVPVDYRQPGGKTIDLFVLKVHYRQQKASDRIGSLLVNPGGPGGSGVNLAASLVAELSTNVFAHFDLIGFDPRGVSLSAPVECMSDAQKDKLLASNPNTRTAAGRATARKLAAGIVKSCVTKYGSMLKDYNTEETARDMDVIRQAVGDDKLNYLGYSYGTRLGAVYAHLFPNTVRVAVLDGAVDPVATELNSDEAQIKGFESAFDQFAADCRNRPACAVLGNPRKVVIGLMKSADVSPIPSSKQGETRKATGGLVMLGVLSALYDQSEWPTLGDALIKATRGDSAGLLALGDNYSGRDSTGHYANILDANLAVNCNDSTLRVTDSLVATKAAEWVSKYPIFGNNAASSLYACYGWPTSGHPLPPATATTAPPILVVGTVHDPATPFKATSVLAKTLGVGTVLSWDGEGHTAYPKTPCITGKVDSYLITAKIPTDDSCPAR